MSEPYWSDGQVSLYLGDCIQVLREMEPASVDSIVTDPPYGLEFMGKEWDGADGFRRSLNDADAGRDSVFGRMSRTSPEYRTGSESWRAGAGMTKPGIGERPTEWPAFGGRDAANPTCAGCGGRLRGAKKCACPEPEWRVRGEPVDERLGQKQLHLFQEWCQTWAAECLRVLKPGGHMLAFGGARTWHRMTCAVEDAGFEIREPVADLTGMAAPGLLWCHSQGFPKSRNVSKDVEQMTGTKQWEGWGTALRPSWEPILVARKPLAGIVAANVLRYGTGALNIDACRVATGDGLSGGAATKGSASHAEGWDRPWKNDAEAVAAHAARVRANVEHAEASGRWPANLVLAHSPSCVQVGERFVPGDSRAGQVPGKRPGGFGDVGADSGDPRPNGALHGPQAVPVFKCAEGCPVAEMDRQSGVRTSGTGAVKRASAKGAPRSASIGAKSRPEGTPMVSYGDSGGASRFFPVFRYHPKARQDERPELEDGTRHSTVKPVALMEWLCRLVTPPGGLILDPFAGSGATAEAAIIGGFQCVLVEKDPKYADLVKVRLRKDIQPDLFGGAA